MVLLSDQFVLCKAALIFALTRFLLSFALNLLTSISTAFFSDSCTENSSASSSSCCSSSSSSSSSSPKLRTMRKNLSLTTFGNIQHRRLPENQDVSCAVCLNRLRKKSQVWELSNCGHVFHKHCLERWIASDGSRSTCPICRASLLAENFPPPPLQPQPPSWAVERMLYLFGDDLLP